jgi:hypothetical protein
MPVRTDRGRVAVYRKLWGWPLRSPRHLAATGVTVAALVIGVTVAAAAVAPDPAPPAAMPSTTPLPGGAVLPTTTSSPLASSSTPTTPTTTASSSSPAAPNTSPPSTTTVANGTTRAVVVAGEFMARWVNHPAGMTSKEWVAQLTPFVVPEAVVVLESVEPANIPATQVTGQPTVTAESPSIVEVDVSTDGGVLHLVVLAQPDGTWRVRSYDLVG